MLSTNPSPGGKFQGVERKMFEFGWDIIKMWIVLKEVPHYR
jgi:hypothetical protein